MTLNRREVLRLGGGLGLAAAGAGLLTGCADSETGAGSDPASVAGPDPAASPTPTSTRSGTVRLAFTGGGANETLDPAAGGAPIDYARNALIFDRLFAITGGEGRPALAEAVEVAPGGAEFTVRLRRDVTWHDSSPLVAADVAHSLRYIADPQRPFPSELTQFLDIGSLRIVDSHTLIVPTLRPVGDPATLIAAANLAVIKDGTQAFDPDGLIGTGPFTLEAFAAGRESRLRRVEGHWGGGANSEEIVLLSLDDPTARVNAVRAGQADYASDVPYTVAKTGPGRDDLEIRSAGEDQRNGFGFVLNTTIAPFDDARVRRAVRLAVDRQALVDTVLLGFGVVANDLFGAGAAYFADDIPPLGRDLDAARALLAEAGADGASFTVRSGEYETGLNSSTELFVEQLKEVGLDARADIVGPLVAFDPEAMARAGALVFPLGPFPLSVIYSRSAAFPSLALGDADLDRSVAAAQGATDASERESAWREAQQIMADRGNWVVWGRGDTLSLARKDLTGIEVRDSAKYPYLGKVALG